MTLKLLEFPKPEKIDRVVVDELKRTCKEIIEAAEAGTLIQVVMQGDIMQEDGFADTACFVWNDNQDIDRLIGYSERLKLRVAGTIYEVSADDHFDPDEGA